MRASRLCGQALGPGESLLPRAVAGELRADVVVIGGGHAGCEAAAASARCGARTVLVTHKLATVGTMSCNPSIGGIGKGHLVREVDALGGLMGRVADCSSIQFRVLNASRGPAVRGPRSQADRGMYRRNMQAMLAAQPNLSFLESEVGDLLREEGRVRGVLLADGTALRAERVVLTTGTFLGGVLHFGSERRQLGGRLGDPAASALAGTLRQAGLATGRLKTGTPPRLLASSIDYGGLEAQPGDAVPQPFSFSSDGIAVPWAMRECHLTWTRPETHAIVKANMHRSPNFDGGEGRGTGPRYCPSIEQKVLRFADRPAHQVWLEPEGLDSEVRESLCCAAIFGSNVCFPTGGVSAGYFDVPTGRGAGAVCAHDCGAGASGAAAARLCGRVRLRVADSD
jgi:tRNA uridine 5-carboxymethylaminomethyl modification enzyme